MGSIRTQIYLDEDQRKALKLMAASSDSTMSDLVRRAIDRLLSSEEFIGKDWTAEMRAVAKRIRASGPELSDDEIDDFVAHRRAAAAAKRSGGTVKNTGKRKVHA